MLYRLNSRFGDRLERGRARAVVHDPRNAAPGAAKAPGDARDAFPPKCCASRASYAQRLGKEEASMAHEPHNRITGFQPVPEVQGVAVGSPSFERDQHGLETRDTTAQNEPTAARARRRWRAMSKTQNNATAQGKFAQLLSRPGDEPQQSAVDARTEMPRPAPRAGWSGPSGLLSQCPNASAIPVISVAT
jgi:hypothetical protein